MTNRATHLHRCWYGAGSPVVLIHGLGSSTEDWEHQLPVLSQQYRVLLVDLPGHGRSPPQPPPHSISGYAAQLAELLDADGVERAHLVGISLGGMVALQLAADAPTKVISVIAVNCPADMRPATLSLKALVLQRQLLVRLLSMKRLGKLLSERLLPGDELRQRRAVFTERWARNDPRQYRAALNAALNWHIDNRLDDIAAPLLVIAASDDYTPLATKKLLADSVADGRLVVIPDSRHATPVEHPDIFNSVLLDFLAAIEH